MSEIKAGDLVMVVRPSECCGSAKSLGKILCVLEKPTLMASVTCRVCGNRRVDHGTYVNVGIAYCERSRLKKIEPLDDAESESANKHLEAV